jgi:uncharacterized membrane protein
MGEFMWQLYFGLVLFGFPHLFSALAPHARNRLKQRLGENQFKLAYSAISFGGIILMALGYLAHRNMPADPLYQPYDSARHMAFFVILAGFILIANNGSRSHLRLWLGHPFSLGVILWSAAHLLVNGQNAVVLIFSTILLIAFLDVAVNLARGKYPQFQPTLSHDIRGLVGGIIVYLIFMFGFHPYILGIPVL